ncbi:hypothetical protein PPERSA_01179 [Pseudocohnilembus persalinus]|uniref:Uncharacterized protein n=1 Tax=Pseudocohnilembus persalinus TaxID=266149 RepID=A0A0V0R141_PSEPJ|nr:hypothetical protein PPERSA_01179 [Pseudocohnilembus persalinus]|eukprot:KRX08249.1 hypothetical protein PPERSA_01179 [Pseudocohnilembus persalinus]
MQMTMTSSDPTNIPEQTKFAYIFKNIYYMRKNKIISEEEKNKLKDYVIEKSNKKIDALFNDIEIDHKSIQEELLDILQDLNDSIQHEESYEFPPLNQIIKSNRKLQAQTSLEAQLNQNYQNNMMIHSLDRQLQQPPNQQFNQQVSKFTFPSDNSENQIQNFQNINTINNFPTMSKAKVSSLEHFGFEDQPTNTHLNYNANFQMSNKYNNNLGSTKMKHSNYKDFSDILHKQEEKIQKNDRDVKQQVSQLQQRNKMINRNPKQAQLSICLNPNNNNVLKSRTCSQIP